VGGVHPPAGGEGARARAQGARRGRAVRIAAAAAILIMGCRMAGAGEPEILVSTDGGKRFAAAGPAGGAAWRGVWGGGGELIAVGYGDGGRSGRIARSRDGGRSWRAEASEPARALAETALAGVWGDGAGAVWAVGDRGLLL